jgi:hypothetical protein
MMLNLDLTENRHCFTSLDASADRHKEPARMSIAEPDKELPPMRSRPAVALCLVGIWFSSDCNLPQVLNQDGLARAATTYRAALRTRFSRARAASI